MYIHKYWGADEYPADTKKIPSIAYPMLLFPPRESIGGETTPPFPLTLIGPPSRAEPEQNSKTIHRPDDKKDGVQARGVHQPEEEGDRRCLLHWEAARPCSEYPPIMTAIKATPTDKASTQDGVRSAPVPDIPPSALEEEAKTRLVSALSKGVHTLVERGHGRERASTELLNEIADGCAPDEEEVGHSVCLLFSRGRGRRRIRFVISHDPFLRRRHRPSRQFWPATQSTPLEECILLTTPFFVVHRFFKPWKSSASAWKMPQKS